MKDYILFQDIDDKYLTLPKTIIKEWRKEEEACKEEETEEES